MNGIEVPELVNDRFWEGMLEPDCPLNVSEEEETCSSGAMPRVRDTGTVIELERLELIVTLPE